MLDKIHTQDKMAERARFEQWYTTHACNYSRDPIGSRDCSMQWEAWDAALQAHAAEAAQAQVQEKAVPVAKWEKSYYGDYPVVIWRGDYRAKVGDKLYTHPQPAQDAKDAKDAARYRWLRDKSGRDGQPYIRCDDPPFAPMDYWVTAGTADACIDRAMAKESGR